ncbi:glycosyltransferase [Clostridium butyricum]|uniref:glycosyltransferase n=1 Tax=Clostridium butyricum TaxID=1492 RepID=UPI003D34B242
MRKCMMIDKPLVSILLAVYKPNENWLIEQLISLNKQNYENLNLYVYDDCPEYPTNTEIFDKYITNFKYKIIRGEVNNGSNKAFEELTKIADGEFFAYCDQDDIWETNKISLMMDEFTEDVTLVCCDLSIIDQHSNKTHESLCDIRKRIVYKSGYGLAKDLLMTNFVTGCAMIVKKEVAMKAVPFIDELVHDQWISIVAATEGKIMSIDKPLVRYRQHSCNQTGILKDVYGKKSYYIKRIDEFIIRFNSLKERLSLGDNNLKIYIDNCLLWLKARKRYSQKISSSDLKIMIKYRYFHKVSILIESLLPFIPDFIFKYIIKLTKKGLL